MSALDVDLERQYRCERVQSPGMMRTHKKGRGVFSLFEVCEHLFEEHEYGEVSNIFIGLQVNATILSCICGRSVEC